MNEDIKSGEDQPEREPLNFADVEQSARCKRRYGRATLTIRRWGPSLVGEHELASIIDAFRNGEVSAEEVAATFVTARIEGHSSTFSWEEADQDRLLRLVAESSTDPRFEATDPEAVARRLVAAQDEERELLRRVASTLSRSFVNTEHTRVSAAGVAVVLVAAASPGGGSTDACWKTVAFP